MKIYWSCDKRRNFKSDKFTEIWQVETAMPRKSRSFRRQQAQQKSERWIWVVWWENVPMSSLMIENLKKIIFFLSFQCNQTLVRFFCMNYLCNMHIAYNRFYSNPHALETFSHSFALLLRCRRFHVSFIDEWRLERIQRTRNTLKILLSRVQDIWIFQYTISRMSKVWQRCSLAHCIRHAVVNFCFIPFLCLLFGVFTFTNASHRHMRGLFRTNDRNEQRTEFLLKFWTQRTQKNEEKGTKIHISILSSKKLMMTMEKNKILKEREMEFEDIFII